MIIIGLTGLVIFLLDEEEFNLSRFQLEFEFQWPLKLLETYKETCRIEIYFLLAV